MSVLFWIIHHEKISVFFEYTHAFSCELDIPGDIFVEVSCIVIVVVFNTNVIVRVTKHHVDAIVWKLRKEFKHVSRMHLIKAIFYLLLTWCGARNMGSGSYREKRSYWFHAFILPNDSF